MKKHLIICFLISVLFTSCRNITSKQSSSTTEPLRILSYNIRHGVGMDGKLDLQRIADIISAKRPDLVALQEVDMNCKRTGKINISEQLARMVGMQYKFAKFMDYQGGEYGMAVLSRLPIIKTIRHQLPKGSEPRCALEIQVKIKNNNSPISFISIHNDWINKEIRVKEIKTLLKALEQYKHPIILAGDFNCKRDSESMLILEKNNWNIPDKKGQKTFPSDKPRIEIDFFAFRNLQYTSLKYYVVDERKASDHRPIYAEITLKKEKAPLTTDFTD